MSNLNGKALTTGSKISELMNLFQISEHISDIGCARPGQNITRIQENAKPMTTMTTKIKSL